MTESARKTLRILFVIIAVAFPCAVLLYHYVIGSGSAPMQAEGSNVLARAEWADGDVLEIYRVEASSSMKLDLRAPKKYGLFSSGSSSGYSAGEGKFQIKTRSEDDRLLSGEFAPNSAGLIVLLGIREISGRLTSSDVFQGLNRESHPVYVEVVRERNGDFKSVKSPPHGSMPEYVVEIGDREGKWHPMVGPFVLQERDGRAFASTPAFQRTLSTLMLRVTRKDGEFVEVSVPNPDYRDPARLPSWTADPKPWRKSLGEMDVLISGIRPRDVLLGAIGLPQFKVESNAGQLPDAYRISDPILEDRFGNTVKWHSYIQFPEVKLLRYTASVERTTLYRWAISDVDVIAEGIWEGSGAASSWVLSSSGQAFGIQKFEFTEDSSEVGVWDIKIEGKVKPGEPLELKDAWHRMAVFTAGSSESSGRINPRGSGYGGQTYRLETRWKGFLSKGESIRFAVSPAFTTIPFEFTIPIDAKMAR